MSLESVAPFRFFNREWIPDLTRHFSVTVVCNICALRGVTSVNLDLIKATQWALRESDKHGWQCFDETNFCPHCASVLDKGGEGGRRGPTAGATTPST